MTDAALLRGVADAFAKRERIVLAVSGGRDSMTLLYLVAQAVEGRDAFHVATYDHGTGPASTEAAQLVVATARKLGFNVTLGRKWPPRTQKAATEADWRAERWMFLNSVARAEKAIVATAHTLDDHIETVCLRILRGSGARGLAGLNVRVRPGVRPGVRPPVRPLLPFRRAEIAEWAAANSIPWVDDPSNISRQHARNRVRLDILPALERIQPGFSSWLVDIGDRAACLREELEQVVDHLNIRPGPDGLEIARADLSQYDSAGLAVLWQAIAARADVVLDHRGTRRLTEFTMNGAGASGARIQLSGGHDVLRLRDRFVIRRGNEKSARHVV